MDFYSNVLFLILYYIRPQEWISVVAAFKPVTLIVAFALVCMVFRSRGFHWRQLLQTPHDWLLLLYFLWIVLSNRSLTDTFFKCNNLFVFYLVTVQALTSPRKIQSFLGWWTFMILVVAGLAVLSEYGFDPTHSNELTHGRMKDRLSLNTSIFNNPNMLGHSVYPAVFMLYFLCFWKRPVFMKVATLALVLLPLYCVYLTVSKGAFLCIFLSIFVAISVGRPRPVQIMIFVVAATVGWAGLWTLPRMGELEKSRTDQAIQGRVVAFKYGLDMLKTKINGVGWHRFYDSIASRVGYRKGAHSTYVEVGGETGFPGLVLFLGILYCSLRSLFTATTENDTEERVRRLLYVMLIAYMATSWMAAWSWRGSLFLLLGCIAAFHRLMVEKRRPIEHGLAEVEAELVPVPALAKLAPAMAGAGGLPDRLGQVTTAMSALLRRPTAGAARADTESYGLSWNRLTWVDFLCIALMTWITIRFWIYIMQLM
jgi:O-antigen ligase